MSAFFDKTLREVIEVSASNSPTPGGGSVSAMVACFGVAMTAMVCNLTVGKEKFKDVEPQVQAILDEANAIIKKLEKLVDEDMMEFSNFMKAYQLPKNTDEEKATRTEAVQKALKSATDTPMEIARVCLQILAITEKLSTIGNKMAISDAGVAAYVAESCVNAVLLSADINIPMIKDEQYVQKVLAEKAQLVAEAKKLKDMALTVVQERMK
ncbi:Formiminotransferase-cyclodeaminase [Desulfofarcimen acetoxidans DSM 771]|uniref:Formiminotransferase-cyclodeaminase n=1 Tax=Desulfofarcimen acetoxidans (strain ATCC 49208 / DSM 771 / KCTC 5769 / VKM B-1644 / 5575) TaxID=485916 RepID=C8W0Y5_DESAS|nr:cyclodeaminase/cyclohydrolase family protein [Desulfofarcimen acetoxidans]ACV63381.1 Formiminotransferase-cyclodeaminase [Desulfofarcimen acetoxidans DSM 771]